MSNYTVYNKNSINDIITKLFLSGLKWKIRMLKISFYFRERRHLFLN